MLLLLIIALQGELAHAKVPAAVLTHQLKSLEKSFNNSTTPPCDPTSECFDSAPAGEPSLDFCSRWNPDFIGNDRVCCGPMPRKKRVHPGSLLIKKHRSRCDEMTPAQKEYSSLAAQNKLGDILVRIQRDQGKYGDQAFCTVNNGFLANGRRIVPTEQNRLLINSPGKCTNFGTDAMAGFIEWLGRVIAKGYSEKPYTGVRLVLGDVSGPRGGSHYGPSGRRGHASHTNGQDADIGFLTVKVGQETPSKFTHDFNAAGNWWMLKQIFKNPFACIKVIFLDRKHIRALTQFASKDVQWQSYKKFIRHMPGHKNHMHVRIGKGPGLPGCEADAHPELEFEEDLDSDDNSLDLGVGADPINSNQPSVIPISIEKKAPSSKTEGS